MRKHLYSMTEGEARASLGLDWRQIIGRRNRGEITKEESDLLCQRLAEEIAEYIYLSVEGYLPMAPEEPEDEEKEQ